jgi:hypothetical protein
MVGLRDHKLVNSLTKFLFAVTHQEQISSTKYQEKIKTIKFQVLHNFLR